MAYGYGTVSGTAGTRNSPNYNGPQQWGAALGGQQGQGWGGSFAYGPGMNGGYGLNGGGGGGYGGYGGGGGSQSYNSTNISYNPTDIPVAQLGLQGSQYHDNTLGNMNTADNQTQRYLGDQQYGTQRYLGDQNYQLGLGQNANQRYGIDQQYNLGVQGLANNKDVANINNIPQLQGLQNQMARFNQVFPFAQGMAQNIMGQGFGNTQIDANPIWNQQQSDQQTQNVIGQNNAATRGNIQDMQQGLASRGLGAGSGLGTAEQDRMNTQNMIQNGAAKWQIPFGIAQQNAQQLLQAQIARGNQGVNQYNARAGAMAPIYGLLGSMV